MFQFFVNKEQVLEQDILITGKDVNHIKNVLRMKKNEVLRVSDFEFDYLCELDEAKDDVVKVHILSKEEKNTELSSTIYLFQGIPKGDRMETVIEKAVELGVSEIIPVEMKHCVVKLDDKKALLKQKKWQQLAETAAKQSKRGKIPTIHSVMKYKDAIAYALESDLCLVPYENERGMEKTREVIKKVKPNQSISVLIGPEGGFSQEEIELVAGKMEVISLGNRILRTDTAGITVMSMLMLTLEQ